MDHLDEQTNRALVICLFTASEEDFIKGSLYALYGRLIEIDCEDSSHSQSSPIHRSKEGNREVYVIIGLNENHINGGIK